MDTTAERPILAADIIDAASPDTLRLEGADGDVMLIRGGSPHLRRLLSLLDGHHRLASLILDLPLEEQFAARRMVKELLASGLVRSAPTTEVRAEGPLVALLGAGLVARLTASRLLLTPGIRLHLIAPEAPPLREDPQGRYVDAAAALRARLVRGNAGLSRRVYAGGTWTSLSEGSHDLVVVATPMAQPDRMITAHLIRDSLPYLTARAHRGAASLGPLADYQGGACLHCTDLTRADSDPDWPQVAEHLSRLPAQVDTGLAHLVADLAAQYATWFLENGGNALRGATLELSLRQPGMARRVWDEHPDCACSWRPALWQDDLRGRVSCSGQ